MPPMYSASKHKGKPLYTYARKNITVKREFKERYIYDLKFILLEGDVLTLSNMLSRPIYVHLSRIFQDFELTFMPFELNRCKVEPFENT